MRKKLADFLRVDRNSWYKVSQQTAKDKELAEHIKTVLTEHKHYGHRRVAMHLGIGKNRAKRVMRLFDLHPAASPHQRHYKQHKGVRPAPPNLIKELGLVAERPGHIWACDFTYLWLPYFNRWYYVATIIDLHTREIVGWSVGIHHDTKLILSAMYDALSIHPPPMYLHFDRGSEYLSEAHLNLCGGLEIMPSASEKGSPWQNGFQERFYGSFKTELGALKNITSEGELFERIALTLNYYNTKRIHTKLKTNPRQFRQNYNDKNKTQLQVKTEVRDKVLPISGT